MEVGKKGEEKERTSGRKEDQEIETEKKESERRGKRKLLEKSVSVRSGVGGEGEERRESGGDSMDVMDFLLSPNSKLTKDQTGIFFSVVIFCGS